LDIFNLKVKLFNSEVKRFSPEVKRFNSKVKLFSFEVKRFNSEVKRFNSEVKRFNLKVKLFSSEVKRFNQKVKSFTSEVKLFNLEVKRFNRQLKAFGIILEIMGSQPLQRGKFALKWGKKPCFWVKRGLSPGRRRGAIAKAGQPESGRYLLRGILGETRAFPLFQGDENALAFVAPLWAVVVELIKVVI
jgi:hypothetical protein